MRLIDADKLFEFVMSEEGAEILRHSTNMTLRVKDIIERQPTIEAEPDRSGRCGMCKTHDNGYGRINLYSGGGWQMAICKGVKNYEMVISHNVDHFATRIDYCPYCGERLDVE